MKAVQPALAIRESEYLAGEPFEWIFGRRCVTGSWRNRRAAAGLLQPVRRSASAISTGKERTSRTETWRDLWFGLPRAVRSERHLQIHLGDFLAQPHYDLLHAWVGGLGRGRRRGHRVE